MKDDEKGPGEPGSPFCPANGTEGMLFFEGWCELCIHDTDEKPCELIGLSMICDKNDPDYPTEWVYGDDGWGKCDKFQSENVGRKR